MQHITDKLMFDVNIACSNYVTGPCYYYGGSIVYFLAFFL